jgi:DNA-binding response OmpR family regulator
LGQDDVNQAGAGAGSGERDDGDSVDSHVKNLRRKVEQDPGAPQIVQTVLGGGYRLGLAHDD